MDFNGFGLISISILYAYVYKLVLICIGGRLIGVDTPLKCQTRSHMNVKHVIEPGNVFVCHRITWTIHRFSGQTG